MGFYSTRLGGFASMRTYRTGLPWSYLVHSELCESFYRSSESDSSNSKWRKEVSYDYHPDLAKSDEESVEAKLGDCSICMERISADQGELSHNRSPILDVCWREMTKKRRVYALAPCGHNFVRPMFVPPMRVLTPYVAH
jgi:hypothetical protein